MDRFAGRVAVVTGASSGIGASIARDLAKAGMVVVGVARRKGRLTSLAASLKAEGAKGRLEVVQADLSSVEEVQRVFQWVDANLGGVSVAVNNAALLVDKPVQDLDVSQMQAMVSINLTALMVGCKEALNSMQKHGIEDGHIVNISSIVGHLVPNFASSSMTESMSAYSATKHAVTALCKGLRYDVQRIPGSKTRVTSLSPGIVQTEMLPKDLADGLIEMDAELLLNTADVSNAVLYVLSCPRSVEITELTIQPTGEKLF